MDVRGNLSLPSLKESSYLIKGFRKGRLLDGLMAGANEMIQENPTGSPYTWESFLS